MGITSVGLNNTASGDIVYKEDGSVDRVAQKVMALT